jgi:hypothetical protein
MANFNTYQVTLDEDGEAESTLQLLVPEPEKKRVITVRAETPNQARKIAEDLFSLAK